MGDKRHPPVTPGQILTAFVGSFVDELYRSGVTHACVCPGSRSTPLALLLRAHPGIQVWTHLDERSAAFFALGMAKVLQKPVALVSTSGTAAVNFAPAVVEAHYGRVPLLVLTADRPSELREVGALQTIDQVQLFGSHVKWFVEMPLPDASDDLVRYARSAACRAAATAQSPHPGPVHINFPFREPLIPSRGAPQPPASRIGPSVSVPQTHKMFDWSGATTLAAELRAVQRGLIVCGPQNDPLFPAAVVRLAEALDFPILADALSQVRCGHHHNSHIIDSYDAFLRDDATVHSLTPEVIVRFSQLPVSKPLQSFLQRHRDCRQILVDEAGWNDPLWSASDVLHLCPHLFCDALHASLPASTRSELVKEAHSSWMNRWKILGTATRTALQHGLNVVSEFSEPRIFVELAKLLPAGTTVAAGNSMPVRDLDTFFPGGAQPIQILANRGASGIDGVVSTALGASAVSAGPLVLVIGDLSFYHDLNGLLAVKRHNLRVTIILINNDGGGIFSFLPQAAEPEHFEELFGTPHGLTFRHAAALYDLAYQQPASWEDFRSAVHSALTSPTSTLIEVRTDRHANVQLHRRLWEQVSQFVQRTTNAGSSL